MKKEIYKIKPTVKDYKRTARELYPIVPTKVHKNRAKYDRKKSKQKWQNEWRNGEYDF